MFKLLAPLLRIVDWLIGYFEKSAIKREAREELVHELEEKVQANVEKAEAAVAVPDAARDERLRSKYDRSGQHPGG